MCGIFIAYNHVVLERQQTDSFKSAIAIAGHRGPDNIGHFSDDHCFLGHSRLAILDLDKSSNQPFRYGNLVLTYNGEVFNYEDLRTELQKLGHTFRTESDTEVVITAYAQWGVECFSRFNGMWALAIYDSAKGELVVSRDRFGQKPLFFSRSHSQVYFASEFQQLSTLVDKDIDYGLIQMFLKEGTYEGEGRTFLRTIQEFPKAHYLRITKAGNWESKAYWHYWDGKITQTDDRSLESFNELLSDAVRLRLRSDVPFALLVSGGVDSTLIAHYAREHSGETKPIQAFTYSSSDAYDETAFAKRVAERLDLDFYVRSQEQEASDYKTRLKSIVRHLGRGHSSPAVVSIDYLYESVASHGARVALDGQGADELLAGYKTYHLVVLPWYLLQGRWRQFKLAFRDLWSMGFFSYIILALRNILPPPLKKIMRIVYGYERLFKRYSRPPIGRWMYFENPVRGNSNFLNRYLIWYHNLGLENLIYYGDIVAMKNSVENRSPFMDHRLVDFAFRHDDSLKLHDAIDKYVLRASRPYQHFKDVLEREKIGFSSDIATKTKLSMIEDIKTSPILNWPIFSSRMREFIATPKAMLAKYERIVFRLYQVHLWNEIFIEETPVGDAAIKDQNVESVDISMYGEAPISTWSR
jgi:asparagine synthase (glutamine-hydrolysing)